MKKLILLFSFVVLALTASAQTTVTPATVDSYAAGSLKNETSLTLTGEWTEANLNTLRAAIKTAQATPDLTTANQKLQTVDMSGFTLVASATAVEFIVFQNCQKLETITMPTTTIAVPVSIGDGKNNGLFQNCKVLKEADISMFTNITNLQGTFNSCEALETIKMPASNSVAVTTQILASNCFRNCFKLKGVDFSGFAYLGMYRTFSGSKNLLYVVLPEKVGADPFGDANATVVYNPDCLLYHSEALGGGTKGKMILITGGRNTYACATKITLDPAKEFICPEKFTATAGIEYTRNITASSDAKLGWESICLPYSVDLTTGITKGTTALGASEYNLSTATPAKDFATASSFLANTPYIFRMSAASGAVTFASAAGAEVQATTNLTNASSANFDMACAYLDVATSNAVYALDATGAKFVQNGGAVAPFHAYVVNKTGATTTPAEYKIAQGATGIDASANDKASALNIYAADGKLVIESAKAQTVKVSSIDGITRELNVAEGANEFQLPQGIYIVNKQKVAVR
ncbi:MAG: leucine-rich repeat protein [Bacteroidaceae bacterium]